MEITIPTILLLMASGLLVGILSAMFGIGGGTIIVPLLHMLFGLPARMASATSLFTILPTSISGVLGRMKDGTINIKVGLVCGIAGACFSPLGALAATYLPGYLAMILMGVLILYTAFNMFKKVWQTSLRYLEAKAAKAAEPVKPAPLENAPARTYWVSTVIMGMIVGFLSGYLGLGGGFIIVPMLQWAYGFTMKQSTGTSLVSVAILAVPSFITHALLGNIAWLHGLLIICGSVVGARIGAVIVRGIDDRLLRALFGIMLVVTACMLIIQEVIAL